MRLNGVTRGEYFADFDEGTGMWCVFHTHLDTGHAYRSYLDRKEAERKAADMNNRDGELE